jgi:pyruvate dehydrogenase E1 component
LRSFFEVDRFNIAYAALYALYRKGMLAPGELLSAREKLGIKPDKANPARV